MLLLLLHAAAPGTPLNHVVVEASSALGDVGLSTGVAAPALHWSGKLGLILMMWMGRLEIVPVLVLLAALIVGARYGVERPGTGRRAGRRRKPRK